MKIEKNQLQIVSGKRKKESVLQVHHIFTDNLSDLEKEIEGLTTSALFTGEMGSQYIDYSSKKLYLGLGKIAQFHPRKLAKVYLKLGEQIAKWVDLGLEIELKKDLCKDVSVKELVYHVASSLEIGAFSVDVLSKTYSEKKFQTGKVFISVEGEKQEVVEAALEKSGTVTRFLNTARIVEHLPANHFVPDSFVDLSKQIAKECKLKITVFDQARLEKEGMGGILSVGKGSVHSPKMIILEYTPTGTKGAKKLAIIGKGLTFDTGGISIKPSAEMHEMKYDMCGAAATITAIGAIASLGLKVPIIAAIGVAENMPDGNAIKPGDVYTAYNGLTVEVQNTDAEGRLVLGDVLSYVSQKYKPEYMIDLATLTGAVIIALGHETAGLMSNSEELTNLIKKASLTSEDRVWELPLWEEYAEDLKSDIADVKNITGGRAAGTVTAAKFLQKFVEEPTKWAHLDIAGTAWRSKSSGTQCSGPTGYGVRLLVDLAENLLS